MKKTTEAAPPRFRPHRCPLCAWRAQWRIDRARYPGDVREAERYAARATYNTRVSLARHMVNCHGYTWRGA